MEFKKPIYPIEQWNITETEFKKENNYRNETTFALSNGYIGTRGTFEEAYPFDVDTGLEGNFVNGFYESNEIRYGEANFGSPLLSQSLLNLPNLKEIHVILDGEEFTMEQGEVKEYARTLHMKDGILERKLTWTAPSGKVTEIHIFRLVSFARKNIMAIRYQVKSVNYAGTVEFVSKMQADVENHTRKTNPIVDYGPFGRRLDPDKVTVEKDTAYYEGTTKGSHLTMACGSSHELWCDGQKVTDVNWMAEAGEMDTISNASMQVKEGKCVTLDKFICYSTSLDMEKEKLEAFVQDELAAAKSEGYEKLKEQQKNYMQDFWKTADVEIKGNEELQQGLHFNLFHIIQSAGRDGRTGMGAKGLSGEGYEGHYFWDTEMYMLPFFIYTQPQIAKQLLHYRFSILPQARERARSLGVTRGALYAWRTINGEEASAYFPAGTAQYHINADIAHTVKLYFDVTNDQNFLREQGAAVVLETARFWLQFGSWQQRDGRSQFCLYKVTGPDEYTALVDNNYYTNRMAKENMAFAAWLLENHYIDGDADEQAQFTKASTNMYLPYDQEQQVTAQDDNSPKMPVWPFATTAATQYPLLLHYHPLMIYRHRVNKQADTLLAEMLFPEDQSLEQLRRDYEYYEPITTHDSSLSRSIFSILASRLGDHDKAFSYYMDTSLMDLVDLQGNAKDGLHEANLGGSWLGLTYGFAGMYVADGKLHITNHLPTQITHLSYRLRFRGRVLEVQLYQDKTQVKLVTGLPLVVVVAGKEYDVLQGARSE